MMSDFASWLVTFIITLIQPIWEFLIDAVINLASLICDALAALITAIPVPQFITTGLQSSLSAIPSDVWFFASHFRLADCLAILGAAVTFRLARKALTLFQW